MDLDKTIRDLRAEIERIERTIAKLEEIQKTSGDDAPQSGSMRRGRKSMDDAERCQVSKRMKEYWKSRRSQDGK